MIENKTVTVREMIDEAIGFYNKGEWNAAIASLYLLQGNPKVSVAEDREIDMHLGWNDWKKQNKDMAKSHWLDAISDYYGILDMDDAKKASPITKASAHAGLGIYYAEKGDKEKALYHAKLAQDLLPENATMNQAMNLNACGISLAKIGELKLAEEVLRKVAKINEQLEKSDDPIIAKKAKHQRAKNGYNLASLVYFPQKKWQEAIKELNNEVAPRYVKVGAETDLAAAYHRLSEAYESIERPGIYKEKPKLEYALILEEKSLALWQKHPDDPKRIKTAAENIARIKEKIKNLKQ